MGEEELHSWLDEAAAALGIEAPTGEVRVAVLALARDVAHNIARPGAPLTAYLLGIAVGRGADPLVTQARLSGLATRAE